MGKFKVGDRVVSNENYMNTGFGRVIETGVVTEIYDGNISLRSLFPITVVLDGEHGTEGLFAEKELDVV